MDKFMAKVISIEIGKFDVDSIIINLDGVKTSICFNKTDNIAQYDGKDIFLTNDNGVFSIEPHVENKTTSKK